MLVILTSLFCCSENDPGMLETSQPTNLIEDKNDTMAISPFAIQEVLTDGRLQTFEIEAGKLQKVQGEEGTLITFQARCFGAEYGFLKVKLIECYSLECMLYRGLSTQDHEGMLLESAGMFYLNVFDSLGNSLEFDQGKIEVLLPVNQLLEDFLIFEGDSSSSGIIWNLPMDDRTLKPVVQPAVDRSDIALNVGGDDYIDSVSGNTNSVSPPVVDVPNRITDQNIVGYAFQLSRLGWTNCDRYIEGKNHHVKLNIPEADKGKGATYYMVLRNFNSILHRDPSEKGSLEFKNVPVGEPFTIVGFGMLGEELYFSLEDYKGADSTINLESLVATGRDEISSKLVEKFGQNIWGRPNI